jgi:flagellar assembly factor FliW
MAQIPSGLDASAVPEVMSLVPLAGGREELSRAVFAVNDAGNLADALDANLGWMAEILSSAPLNDDVRDSLRDDVEVCRQLTRLLGGAIGSCRTVARTIAPRVAPTRLSRLVEVAVGKISRLADAMGILVLSDGPQDLSVQVDPELMNSVLETLFIQAVNGSPIEGVVRISFARCGGHAVIGLTSDGPGLSISELEQLYSASAAAISEGAPTTPTSEALRAISTTLFEQGGYIDTESRPDGGTTLFVVVPASDESLEEPIKSGTVLARDNGSPRQHDLVPGQKRSDKMILQSDRFGAVEIDAADVLTFPAGIIGFPKEDAFVLVRRTNSQMVGWLQSTKSSYLALPVVSAHLLSPRFPDVQIDTYAERAGLGNDSEELAVLAVLSAPPGQPATVNLMAPIIVNATTRVGAQLMLEGTQFTTRELFIFPASSGIDLERTATAMPNEEQPATSAAE